MKCKRLGCTNKFRGNGRCRHVEVIDERLIKRKVSYDGKRTEAWCLECCGNYEPGKYNFVYTDRDVLAGKDHKSGAIYKIGKLILKQIPKPKEEVVEESYVEQKIAEISSEEDLSPEVLAALKPKKVTSKKNTQANTKK